MIFRKNNYPEIKIAATKKKNKKNKATEEKCKKNMIPAMFGSLMLFRKQQPIVLIGLQQRPLNICVR